jgi:hypothetical protein
MKSSTLHGLTAGLIAAATFAAWFLLVDVVKAQPLATPAYMSGLIFSFTTALPASARLFAFTLLHFVSFAVVGMIVASLLEKWQLKPLVSIGFPLGFLLFDLSFYGSMLLFGVDIVRALGWPQVLTGNVLAAVVMMAFLKAKSGAPVFTVRETLERSNTLRRGLVAGVIGAAVVGAWFFVLDASAGRLFYTPAALGSAVFFGASHPGDVVISAGVVLGYTLVHLAGFVLAGLAAAWLMEEASQYPPFLIGLVLLFVTLEVLSLGLLTALASWLFETVPSWSPIVANLIAAMAMVGYLWRQHPAMAGRMNQPLEEEAAAYR